MTIDIEHTCEDCKSFHEGEPCLAGVIQESYELVGDCTLFEYQEAH
jgi:hypothetical protein